MKKLKFNKAQHKYTIEGKPLTGVTTILGIINKPALLGWSCGEAVNYIKENSPIIGEMYQVSEKVLNKAKTAYTLKRDAAGLTGTEIHLQIEEYLKTGKSSLSPQFLSFQTWFNSKQYEVVECEKQLYSEKYWFAGTVDMILKDKEGKLWIADIKTSKGIYNSYIYQMGGYEIAYCEENPGSVIEGYIIIHITNFGSVEEYIVPKKDTTQAKTAFISALKIYRAEHEIDINNYKQL